MNGDIVPTETLQRAIRWWWLVAIIMIAGGFAGMLVTRLHKPVYESQASITTSIDYAFAGRLSDEEVDYLLSTIGDVIGSNNVTSSVMNEAVESNLPLTAKDVQTKFTQARQGFRWELSVRDGIPGNAQTLTQLWINAAMSELVKLRENSLDSLHYQTAQLALEECFSQTVILNPVSASCSLEQISQIHRVFDQTSAEAKSMTLPESILLSKISVQISENASLPTKPTLYRQNFNTLVGAVMGLLIGLSVVLLWNPRKK